MSQPQVSLAPDAFSGRKLGKYELICRLSAGGMSELFLAFQLGLAGFRKLVVLKRILPDIQGQEEFVRLFLDEAKITAAFNHPHIAHVYDLDVADGELFLAMEFIHGATLIEVVRACREARVAVPVGFALAAVRDTAVALHYAHTFTDPTGRKRQVIHRDVAEKNVMVTYDGVTKLLDFGIAKQLGARHQRTTAGMVRGTTGYMSPEQVMGDPLDARSDIFSLGTVLHQLLTGLRLFKGKTPQEELAAPLTVMPTRPSERNPEVKPAVDAVVLKALEKDRNRRFASALEMARALEQAAGSQIWLPEKCGELVRRFFAARIEQTRVLLQDAAPVSAELNAASMVVRALGEAPPAPPPKPLVLAAADEVSAHLEGQPRTSAQTPRAKSASGPARSEAQTIINRPSPIRPAQAVQKPLRPGADEAITLKPGALFITPQPMLDPAAGGGAMLGASVESPEPPTPSAPALAPEPKTVPSASPLVATDPWREAPVPFRTELEPKTIIDRGASPLPTPSTRPSAPTEPPTGRGVRGGNDSTDPQGSSPDDEPKSEVRPARVRWTWVLLTSFVTGALLAAAAYLALQRGLMNWP
ncbi:MAG: serine/threonine protein kinase [Myxococcota bacterium]